MFPHRFELLGTRLEVWDLTIGLGILLAYFLVVFSFRVAQPPPRPPLLRPWSPPAQSPTR